VGTLTYPKTLSQWYSAGAFAAPLSDFGNTGRNLIEGPGYFILNVGVAKNIDLERAGRLQIAASFQNVLNHFNYGPPLATINNSNTATITSTAIFPPAGSPRTGRLSLRWSF
ncbi:MAG: hypothetical protein ACRD9L_19965, partial [Bryobacteraceae bacterium]